MKFSVLLFDVNSPTFCEYILPILLIFKYAFLHETMAIAVGEFYLFMFLLEITMWLSYEDLSFLKRRLGHENSGSCSSEKQHITLISPHH